MASLPNNLSTLRADVLHCYPKMSVGWIGNAAHQVGKSDHNPDSVGKVHALDFMTEGNEAQAAAIIAFCMKHKDSLQYIIHNRKIASRSWGWTWKAYTGTDPHTNHVHVSGMHGSAHATAHTEAGYDLAAEKVSILGSPCQPSAPAKPSAPVVKPMSTKPGSRTIRQGSVGQDVTFIQKFIGQKQCGKPDGKYGPQTAKGVKWYQDMRGLKPIDGVCGPITWKAMGVKYTGK